MVALRIDLMSYFTHVGRAVMDHAWMRHVQALLEANSNQTFRSLELCVNVLTHSSARLLDFDATQELLSIYK